MHPERTRCLALAGFVVCVASACDDSKSRTDLPDWSDGYDMGGPMAGGSDVDGGPPVLSQDGGAPVTPDTMSVAIPAAATWPMRIGQLDALSAPCEIERDDPETDLVYEEGKKIKCLIDMDELDLWVLGLQFDVVIPEGMCEYLLRVPYVFENFQIGNGPTVVSYTKEEDGTCSNEVNSENCEAVCEYDYKRFDDQLPNCCYGRYTLEITSAKTGKVSTATKSWGGGKLGECYYGGGYLDGFDKDTEGFPTPEIIYIAREAYVSRERFDGLSEKYGSNVALANYVDPDDHVDGAPAAVTATYANHPYEYYCLDHAEENIAHIEVYVREWNEEAEFDVEGDPDTLGTEPDWELPLTDDINDITDWKDFGDADEEYPMLPHL